jgi:putative aminopeptidase FrvX
MLSDSSLAVLKRLLDTPGPSGFEAAAARLWRQEASSFAEVSSDVVGNSYAVVNPGGSPTIMLAGHIDEIGVICTYIDDNGFVYIAGIGGWDPQVLVGQRIRFLGEDGDVIGVVGKKPIHLMKRPEDREKAPRITDLWVDIGVSSRVEAEEYLRVGDAGVIDARTIELPNRRIASRSIDNRMVAVATTQEEIAYAHGGGALTGATRLDPAMAIVVDVSFASDHPGLEKKELGDHRIGGGPILPRGSLISPVVFELLRTSAKDLGIPHTVRAMPRETSTDADAIAMAREGVAIGLVDIPNRYMHSPNEMVSLDDLDRAATLIAEACRRVDHSTDFTAR